MNFILTAAAIAYICICGYGLIKLILKDNIPFSMFGLIPLSFGTGLGVLAVLCNMIMLLGFKLSFATTYMPLSVLFIYALTQVNLKFDLDTANLLRVIKKISWKEWLMISVLVSGIAAVVALSLVFPLRFWDSRAIWAAKAKMLYYSGTIFSNDFMDANRVHAHLRYPLLFPLSQAYLYMLLGMVDDWALMLFICLFLPFMALFVYDLVNVYLQDREKALAAAAVTSVIPAYFMSGGLAYSGLADIPLALLYILSFGITLLWKQNKDMRYLILSAFLSGILFLTKNEGMNLILLNLLLITLPYSLKAGKEYLLSTAKAITVFCAVLLCVTIPWLILVRQLPVPADVNDILQLDPLNLFKYYTKLPMINSFSFRVFLGTQANIYGEKFLWGILWVIFTITSIISIINRLPKSLQLFLVVLLNFLIITITYVLIPDTSEGFLHGNLFRIYLPITAVAVIQIVTTIKEIESPGPKT